jgi:nucleoid-associated protein YgaU
VTREHKLALIVGFSLLLLVGVLISDHLSKARATKLDVVVPEKIVAPGAVKHPEAPVDPVRSVAGPASTAAVNPGATIAQAPAAARSLSEAADRAGIGTPREPEPILGGQTPDDPLRRALTDAGARIVRGPGGIDVIQPDPSMISQKPSSAEAARPVGAAGPQNPPVKPDAARPPDRLHTVKKSETLYAIAKQYYGSGELWKPLAEYNKDRVGKNGVIREGASIRIPPKPVLTGKPDPQPAKPEPVTPAAKAIAADTRVAGAETYTVQSGDTLGQIALKVLGSSRRWPDLLKVNKSLIDDEDHLMVGMVLKVPHP